MNGLNWIVSSCVMILAAILIRAVLGKRMRPGLRYALWGIVLLRLLFPGTVLSSPVSVQNVTARTEFAQNLEAVRDVSSIEHNSNGAVEGFERYDVMPDKPVIVTDYATPERFKRMKTAVRLRDLLLPLWRIGTGITIFIFIVLNGRLYSSLRSRRKRIENEGRVRVYSVENLSSSCLFGGAIYVAADTAADENRLRHVLAHEMSHLRHGDHIWASLRCAALALHWYNPLVWLAASLSRRDGELFADAGALKSLGDEERENYGATLIELSVRHEPRAPLLCTATTMTGGKRALRERVGMIASRPRMTAAVVAAVLLITSAAVGCSFWGADRTGSSGLNGGPAVKTTKESGALTGDEIKYFNNVFFAPVTADGYGQRINLRNQFLSSEYERPEDIDLFGLFYCGTGDTESLSDEEFALFGSQDCPTDKLRAEVMDACFEENTGLHIDQTAKKGLDEFRYSQEFDAYYHTHGDTNYRAGVRIEGGVHDGELVRLYYIDGNADNGWKCVTLRKAGRNAWHFVSNVWVEKPVLPTVYPDMEPWAVVPLSGLEPYEPEKVEMVRHVDDCAERYGGWVVGDGPVVRLYKSTDGRTYAAVMDDEEVSGGSISRWEARSFHTIPSTANNPEIYAFHLFGYDGIVVSYGDYLDKGLLGRHLFYYAISQDGTAELIAHVLADHEEAVKIKDLDGDGEDELAAVSGRSAQLFFKRDGRLYEADVFGTFKNLWNEDIYWDYADIDTDWRRITVVGMVTEGESNWPTFWRYIYFDGEKLLIYKSPDLETEDHEAPGIDAPQEVVEQAKTMIKMCYDGLGEWADDWCLSRCELTEVRRGDYTIEVYGIGALYHAGEPKKLGMAGGTYLREDGWVAYDGSGLDSFLIYKVQEDKRQRLEGTIPWVCGPQNDYMFPAAVAEIELLNGLRKPSEMSGLELSRMLVNGGTANVMEALGAAGEKEYTYALEHMLEYAQRQELAQAAETLELMRERGLWRPTAAAAAALEYLNGLLGR